MMKSRYVVDTNVLIAASAVDAHSPVAAEATPEDPVLRMQVWKWLDAFQRSPTRLVLDGDGAIENEYCHKLGFNDFGRQMVIHKWSTCAVDLVEILFDDDGYGDLDPLLATVVHDRSDRKLVAAALAAIEQYGECSIANAGDTDWYDWEAALTTVNIEVEQIIPEWSRQKWVNKQQA